MELAVGKARGLKTISSDRGIFAIGTAATRWREDLVEVAEEAAGGHDGRSRR
ncbi:MAG TPA: hypothetical protein VFA46_05335 [Actinomycetes bacterium]|jgi:hypothetical protein|nr:hypothetical protein [Actinomycetes bacterium]